LAPLSTLLINSTAAVPYYLFLSGADTNVHFGGANLDTVQIDLPKTSMQWRGVLSVSEQKSAAQRSQTVHVPLVALSKAFNLHRFTFVHRNRFEKLIGFGNSPGRYRNRALLDRRFGHDDRWHVFVDDEVFFDLSAAKWNQNRFQVGGCARVSPG
jgi:hypothetical protein